MHSLVHFLPLGQSVDMNEAMTSVFCDLSMDIWHVFQDLVYRRRIPEVPRLPLTTKTFLETVSLPTPRTMNGFRLWGNSSGKFSFSSKFFFVQRVSSLFRGTDHTWLNNHVLSKMSHFEQGNSNSSHLHPCRCSKPLKLAFRGRKQSLTPSFVKKDPWNQSPGSTAWVSNVDSP